MARRRAQDSRDFKERIAELEQERDDFEAKAAGSEEPEHVDNETVALQAKLSETEHELSELRLEYENICSELKNKEATYQRDRIVLSKEIDSFKEQLLSS